jgi:hypothetical protein
MFRRFVVTMLVLIALGAAAHAGLAPLAQVPTDHWAYAALDELCQQGLVAGYPAGPFAGPRPATRQELASAVARSVQGVATLVSGQGTELAQLAQAGATAAPPRNLRAEDLARVEKLIAEFRSELVAMGLRVDDIADALGNLQDRLTAVEQESARHRIDGYLQLRYTNDDSSIGHDEFGLRRARIHLQGPLAERTSYRIELQADSALEDDGPGSRVQLLAAYVDYRLGAVRLRFGQASLPFGIEADMSTTELLAGERSAIVDSLFPSQRDLGIFARYQRDPKAPAFDLAVVNGTGINEHDDNRRKNIVARATVPVGPGSVAVSWYEGRRGEGVSATDQDRFGVGGKVDVGRAGVMGEYIRAREFGERIDGWYAQAAYRLPSAPGTVFAKYDTFDEDLTLPDNSFRRTTVGYAHDLDPRTRLSFVYEMRRRDAAASWHFPGNVGFMQVQIKY